MATATKRRDLFGSLFLLQIILIILIGVSGTMIVALRTSTSIKRPLAERAASIASFFTPQEISTLQGSEADLGTPAYQLLKARMVRVKNANGDVRFVYLTGIKDGTVFFYGDSEDPKSDDYSPPGEKYEEASQAFRDIFTNGQTFVEGPLGDRWGVWLSAIAPIKDDSGKVVGALGIDVAAGNFKKTVYTYAALPLVGMALLLLIVATGYLSFRRRQQYIGQREEFLSLASHELRAPLDSLRQSMENLQKNLQYKEPPERLNEMVDLMVETVQSLSKTANSLTSMAGMESDRADDLNIASVDIATVMRDIVGSLQLTAQQKNAEIIFAASWPASLVVKGDADKLHRALTNVVANAVKYTEPSTTVTISYNRETKGHLITVSDHGPGIPENTGDDIFLGHYRVDNGINSKISGEGLGLYITRRIIEQHGGSIGYSSREGEGSIFFINLPF